MTFAEDIDGIVRASDAYDNTFFAHCKDASKYAHLNDIARMMINWYLVTKHFGLSAPEYTALLARKLKYAPRNKASLLQSLLVESAIINGDDLGIGHDALYAKNGGAGIPHDEKIHYLLYGNLAKKCIEAAHVELNLPEFNGLTITSAPYIKLIHPSTQRLVERIEDEFCSIEGGVAVYQTVESIAYNIVIAYDELENKLGASGQLTLDDKDKLYSNIHQPLEKDHDRQSSRMIGLADQYFGERYRPVMETKVKELCRLFGEFWKAMGGVVFENSEVVSPA